MAGLGIGVYFLVSHDWQVFPAKLASVNTLMLRWSDIRPTVDLPPVAPNVAASLMAITAPFLIAWGAHSWNQARRGMFIIAAVAVVLVAGLIFASTSRGAWMALVVASGIVALIWLGRWAARRTGLSHLAVFAALTSVVLVLLVAAVFLYPGGVSAMVDS